MLTPENYPYRLNETHRKAILRSKQQERLIELAEQKRPSHPAAVSLWSWVAQWLLAAANVVKYMGLLLTCALILAAGPQFRAAANDMAVFDPNGDEAYHPAFVQYRVAHYYYVRGDYERAVEEYSRAIELLPDFSFAYVARGDTYAAIQRYDLAIADYTQAIAIYPASARTYRQRGLAYYAAGDPAHGLADLRQAAEIAPEYAVPGVVQNLQR